MATIVAGLGWAAAQTAWAHCGDECTNPLPLWLGPTSSEIAVDGVLAFSPGYARAERALEFFKIKVLDAMGEEVAGAFEVYADFSVFVWRPAQPWSAGATYTVITHIDTAAWATAEYSAPPGACITYDQETQVTIAAEPLPAPAAPPLVVASEHVVETWDTLADLVCCDGAYPELRQVQGHCPGGDPYRVEYHPGFCTHLREHGQLEVVYDFDREALGAAAASNFAGRLFGPDEQPWIGVQANLRAPGCLRFEALDLARGEVFVDERCHGDDLAGALGPLDLDPTATLAASCAGQAYVCEGEDSWDPEQCTTWPDGQVYPAPVAPQDESSAGETGAVDPGEQVESGGGGCSMHERPGVLALVVVGGLLRRRRARR